MIERFCLAIDPADHATGLCVYADRDGGRGSIGGYRIQGAMAVRVADQVEAIDAVRQLCAGTDLPAPSLGVEWDVVTETWTNPNFEKAKQSLAASRALWESAVLRMGVPKPRVYRVNSSTWQGACGLLGRTARGALGDTKRGAKVLAAQVLGVTSEELEDDAADAVLLGEYWLRAGGAEAHARREEARKARRAGKASAGAAWRSC